MRLWRTVLPFLGLVLISSCSSDLLHSSYSSKDESYTFYDDSTFFWSGYGGYGKGRFKISHDSLSISFFEVGRTLELQLNEKVPNSSNDSQIEVRAIHSDGRPFAGLVVKVIKSNIDTETDQLGIAKIVIPDAILNDAIKVSLDPSPYGIWNIELRGYNRLIAVVINDKNDGKLNQTTTFHLKNKGKNIYLNRTRFRRYLPLS